MNELRPDWARPHASEEARKIAEQGMILRVQVGSGVHGTSVAGLDDLSAGTDAGTAGW